MYKWIVDTHLVCEEFVAAGARVLPPGLALTGRGRREEAAPRYPGKRQGDEGPHPSSGSMEILHNLEFFQGEWTEDLVCKMYQCIHSLEYI